MISDPAMFAECDRCHRRVAFGLALVEKSPTTWKDDPRFGGWLIDWDGPQGDVLCPECKGEDDAGNPSV
jgi:hypothetical protein